MEKITKTPIKDIPELSELAENYEQWGKEFAEKLDKGGKSSDFSFYRKKGLYEVMRSQLCLITKEHCSFCDGHPVGTISTETIEHYFPKLAYPFKAYDWENLFYCCAKCQSEANRKAFQETLKPDAFSYQFSDYFYFDLASGELKVLEHLAVENPEFHAKATAFLIRYGISNNPKRNAARKQVYKMLAEILPKDGFQRDDFPYRYVYDFCVEMMSLK